MTSTVSTPEQPYSVQTEAADLATDAADHDPAAQIFRAEALAYYTGSRRSQGDLLRLAPTWTRWSYWLLVVVVLCGLTGATIGTVDQYVQGMAVVLVEAGAPTIVALLPGHSRPLLRPDMTLSVTLAGYPQATQQMTIDAIADELVGPAAVRERLGAVADTLPVTEPVVLVQAHLAQPTFVVDGQSLRYYAGMQGKVAVRIRAERLLFLLAPALRTWLGGK